MATITLNYNTRNVQAKKMLDFILSSGFFKALNSSSVEVELLSEKRKKLDKELDKYLIDLSDYKFNRDEANDYE